MNEQAESETLLAELRAGGAARRVAVTTLYRDYAGRLRGYYIGQGCNQAQADDLLQECFIRVLRHLDDYRGESGFAAWLWGIARNLLIDAHRRTRPSDSLDDADEALQVADDAPPALERLEAQALEDCVRGGYRAFAADHPDRAQSLSWLVSDALKPAQLAKLLGRSEGATREYLSQCRKKLRPYLQPCLGLLA